MTLPDENLPGGDLPQFRPEEQLAEGGVPQPVLPVESGRPLWRNIYVWLVFAVLLLAWPLVAILTTPPSLSDQAFYISMARTSVYLNTGLMSWLMFFLVWSAQRAAGRPLRDIGFATPRFSDPLIALGFLVGANIVLNGLAWALKTAGLEVPDLAVKALLPVTNPERFAWVLLSISAGVCEESAFRGFLLTQGKRAIPWWPPLIVGTSLAFGAGHLYQGVAGGVLITLYGVMFCVLRLWRGSLWPGIWAHIWQDVGAMALGKWARF